MFSASFMPLQAGSWLMSIFDAFGAMPSNLTVPFTVATVAGSIGVAAGAIAGCSDIVLAGCSSFLLQAVVSNNPHRASTLANMIQLVFLFMMSFLLSLSYS